MPSRSAVVRVGLGLLLIAAAGLKLYGLGVSAVPQVGWFAQPWVQLAVAEWELVLGLWLISGAAARLSWWAALFTFAAFAAVSGYLGSIGVASCGCFGTIQASPWWAFGVDVAALALLAVGCPRAENVSPGSIHRAMPEGLKWVGGAAALLVGLATVATLAYGSPAAALARLRGESLTVADPYLDFGTGKPGNKLEATATIRNWSDRPVRLIGGTSDCSCTALADLPLTVEPGGFARLQIQLNVPVTAQGQLTRTVFLYTDCPDQPAVSFRIGCRVE
jgi:hypothetical protein